MITTLHQPETDLLYHATEEWRPVVGWDGAYEVSNIGRVRSLDRLIVFSDGRKRWWPGTILVPCRCGKGTPYWKVHLWKHNKGTQRTIHRLVVDAFLGPVTRGKEINHKDCDKSNNRLSNLEVVTNAQNMKHGHDNGLFPRGAGKPGALLTPEAVSDIRSRYQFRKVTALELGNQYGVSDSTIRKVVHGLTWKHA